MYDNCDWHNFIHYYEPDEQSEKHNEPDFDNDGITIHHSDIKSYNISIKEVNSPKTEIITEH